MHAGRFDEAARRMTEVMTPTMRDAGGTAVIAAVYAALADAKRTEEAVRAMQALNPKLTRNDWVAKVWLMTWYSQLGRTDLAFAMGEELIALFGAQAPVNAWSWLWAPQTRGLRVDPRFHSFVTKLGMIPYYEKYGPPDNCELAGGR